MNHEYHQGDRSLSMTLHSSNSERLDTRVIPIRIFMYPLFSERKKKQWENTFPVKTSFNRFALVNNFYYTQNVFKEKKGVYLIKENNLLLELLMF